MRGFQKLGNGCRGLLLAAMIMILASCTNAANDSGETANAASDPDAIKGECPYSLSEQAEWNYYPQDNIFGLSAIAYDRGTVTSTVVMVFANKSSAEDIDQGILRKPDYIVGSCRYGAFDFGEDEYELIQKKNSFYVRLTYDSRIEFTGVSFSKGDERENVNVSDHVGLIYCDFRDADKSSWASQDYSEEDAAWSERADRSEKKKENSTCDPIIYDKLAIVMREDGLPPVEEQDGVSICAYAYEFHRGTHNIYGDMTHEPEAVIRFWMKSEAGTEKLRHLDQPKLYLKRDDQYEDVTPSDLEASVETENATSITAYASTHLMELGEGDYRLEVSGHSVDFRIENQTFEVW